MAKPAPPPAGWLAAADLARLFSCTTQALRDLSRKGVIPMADRGNYPVAASVRNYIGHLREARRADSVSASESQLKKARQREIEIRIAREEGDLVDFADVQAVLSVVMGELRSELIGVPASVTRDRKVRTAITAAHESAFGRASQKFAAHAAALRAILSAPLIPTRSRAEGKAHAHRHQSG